jgi:hypothetical protein
MASLSVIVLASTTDGWAIDLSTLVVNSNRPVTATPADLELLGNSQFTPQITTAFLPDPFQITANTSFQASFTYVVSGGHIPLAEAAQGDGVTFTVENGAGGNRPTGSTTGSAMGYGGVPVPAPVGFWQPGILNSVAVALDSDFNQTLKFPSLASANTVYILNATTSPILASAGGQPLGSTGGFSLGTTTVNVAVTYVAATQTLSVSINGNPTVSALINLFQTVGSKAFFGFTASSGADFMFADVTSFTLSGLTLATSPTVPLAQIQQSLNNQSQILQNQNRSVDNSQVSLFDQLFGMSGGSAQQTSLGTVPVGPGIGSGGPPTSNPNGGSDLGSGGFNPQKYTDPADNSISRYAPEAPLPAVFKAMPPTRSLAQNIDLTPHWTGFLLGVASSDPAGGGGAVGLKRSLWPDVEIGATLSATSSKLDTVFAGSTKSNTGSATVFLVRLPKEGLQWFLAATAQYSAMDVARGYFDGTAPTISTGRTVSLDYGATARLGWTFRYGSQLALTPFTSYGVTDARTHGYTEANGTFPMQFNAVDHTVQIMRLGADGRYDIAAGKWLWGGAAWVHQFEGATAGISGSLIGFFPLSVPGALISKDSLELKSGFGAQLDKDTKLTASLITSVLEHQPTAFLGSVGISRTF